MSGAESKAWYIASIRLQMLSFLCIMQVFLFYHFVTCALPSTFITSELFESRLDISYHVSLNISVCIS